MRASHLLIAVCLVALWTISTSAHAIDKAPGCYKRDKLEASIKDERTIPYDTQAPRLKYCHVTHAQKEVATWLFEPLVEDGIGITRVGVTVALIAEFQDEEHGCRGSQQQAVIPGVDFEILVCAPRK